MFPKEVIKELIPEGWVGVIKARKEDYSPKRITYGVQWYLKGAPDLEHDSKISWYVLISYKLASVFPLQLDIKIHLMGMSMV